MDLKIDIKLEGVWVPVGPWMHDEESLRPAADGTDFACKQFCLKILREMTDISEIVGHELVWKKPGLVQMQFVADIPNFNNKTLRLTLTSS